MNKFVEFEVLLKLIQSERGRQGNVKPMTNRNIKWKKKLISNNFDPLASRKVRQILRCCQLMNEIQNPLLLLQWKFF